MRILFSHVDFRFGGVETQFLNLLPALVELGWDVQLLLRNGQGEFLPRLPRAVGVTSLGVGSQRQQVAAHVLRVARATAAFQPDALVSLHPATNVVCSAAAHLAGGRAPVIGTYAGVVMPGRLDFARKPFVRRLTAVRCVSQAVEDGVRRVFGPGVRTVVIRDSVDVSAVRSLAAAPCTHEWLQPERPWTTIITSCRLERSKGVDTVLRACLVNRRARDTRLLVIGDGPDRERLSNEARRMEVLPAVDFLGYQPNPHAFVARSDAFVFGSEREGLATVLLEAMACGVPVVSTRFEGGLGEALVPGVTGLAVGRGDYEALSRAIDAVVEDEATRARLVAAASARVASLYSVDEYRNRYVRLIRAAVATGKK